MKDTVIVGGARTPIGNFGGALKDLPAQKLGELVVRETLARAGCDPALVEEVIVGCVGQTSDAYNVARVIALMAGLPIRTPAYSVQRNCASGLQPFVNAHQNIQSEDADVQVVGGIESMSRAPFVSRDMRWGKRLRHAEFIDSIWEGLTDAFCGQLMGRTAETLAEEFGIGRDLISLQIQEIAARTRSSNTRHSVRPASKVSGGQHRLPPELFDFPLDPLIVRGHHHLGDDTAGSRLLVDMLNDSL